MFKRRGSPQKEGSFVDPAMCGIDGWYNGTGRIGSSVVDESGLQPSPASTLDVLGLAPQAGMSRAGGASLSNANLTRGSNHVEGSFRRYRGDLTRQIRNRGKRGQSCPQGKGTGVLYPTEQTR